MRFSSLCFAKQSFCRTINSAFTHIGIRCEWCFLSKANIQYHRRVIQLYHNEDDSIQKIVGSFVRKTFSIL